MLEAVAVSKGFPGVQALSDVSLTVAPGEIVAVVGENGAGKSTLMKIIAGVQGPDAGTLRLNAREVRFSSVDAAQRAGIVLIHQELNLAEGLDVAANIFLGREPRVGGPLGLISSRIYSDAAAIMQRLGLDVSPRAAVADLSLGQRQLVEIARALSLQSRYLIFDEPTSSLTERETERLFAVIRQLRADGVGILYISHRLKEVCALSDRIVVLRDGRNAGDLLRDHVTHEALISRMVGRELKQFFHRDHAAALAAAAAEPIVRVRDVRWATSQKSGISFDLRPGEVVGMAGLMGAGRTELAETLFGIRRRLAGTIEIADHMIDVRSASDAVEAGVLLVPEDRRRQGLVIDFAIRENIGLPSLGHWNHFRMVDRRREQETSTMLRDKLRIRTPHVEQIVGLLSGGNQQKVVLGKWLAREPKLLLLDEPTRGVDVGAKAEIYEIMNELAKQGVAVLMISSDLEEILGVSDRILVMHEQQLAGTLTREQATEQAIMHLATGGMRNS